MKKNLIRLILPVLLLIIGIWPLHIVKADTLAATSAFGYFFDGAQTAGSKMGYAASTTDGTSLLLGKISLFITFILGLLGVIFLVLTIYGGITWMTAGGNETQVKTAKSIISRAAIGLIIVVSAYAITYFIFQNLPGGSGGGGGYSM